MRRRCRLESGGSISRESLGFVPQAVTGQWRKAPNPDWWVPLAGNCLHIRCSFGQLQTLPPKADNFQLNHLLWTSHRPSPLIKMRSTAVLRMFRQTPRMLRPVPVSAMDGIFGYDINADHLPSRRRRTRPVRETRELPPSLSRTARDSNTDSKLCQWAGN
jgi:hypothetical protein